MNKSTLLLGLLLLCSRVATSAEPGITVFAAASLTEVMDELGRAYTAQTHMPVRFSYAASSALARQIESGAAAAVFVSADQQWMDYLVQRQLIKTDSRMDVASNTLVLVAPAASSTRLSIAPGFAIAQALGARGRLATGNPDSVPVGKYAKEALRRLGVWDSVAGRVIPADNVRSALNFVALGEAPLGIVYATDARGNAKVRVVDAFPADTHDPITYAAAATSTSRASAEDFVRFLGSSRARAIFSGHGFGIP
ncbi:MAG: molybdate ABC transporter substrate-binding protein [Steroidobacteraceae bacterium]